MTNRLASANSPYLLQHAENPVDWYEWGPDALGRAATEDRPLLISIGYAACHWCHVMAHESFEDPAVAELINRGYVAIKIDREERPDLDMLYMAATQAASGHGGWPMTVFATPDGRPFFAGTYFPPVDRSGQPSFSRVLLSLEEAWSDRREDVETQADELARAVASEAAYADRLALSSEDTLSFDAVLDGLVQSLSQRFDPTTGGFGGAPKFPRPSYVEACLVHHLRTGDPGSLTMATTTLDQMARGGIYDHLVGGFARYSVDASWLVPHFEKMLTDQALLARVYLHAFQLTQNPEYAQVVTETLDWVLDELGLEHGLASSVDADAAGEEGSHCSFTPEEVTLALGRHGDALAPSAACARYGITPEGTFEHGRSVLALAPTASLLRSRAEEATRVALLAHRRERIAPGIDDKVLVEWNAMTASILAEAAGVLQNERWASAAARLVSYLDQNFRDANGRLMRAGRNQTVAHLGLLGDHAWLVEAMTRMYELDGDDAWITRAGEIADDLIGLFWDGDRPTATTPDHGSGFFTTGSDAEVLLVRAKDPFDSALPSMSAITATALGRLGGLTGDLDLVSVAQRTVTLLGRALNESPLAVPDLVLAFGWLAMTVEVAVPGPPGELLDAARQTSAPFTLFAHGTGEGALLEARDEGLAYVCRQRVCDSPVSEIAPLLAQLSAAVRG